MESKIEYAIADSKTGEIQVRCDADRERAFRLVAQFNKSALAIERGEHFMVVERTITRTAWEPSNTGIVSPVMRGGVMP